MSTRNDIAASAFANLKPNRRVYPPLYVQQVCQDNESEPNVRYVLAFGIRFDGVGMYDQDPVCWGHMRNLGSMDGQRFFFLTALSLTEYVKLYGGRTCNVDKNDTPELYHDVVRATVLHQRGIVKNPDPRVKTHVSRGHYVDLEFEYDIDCERRRQEHEERKRRNPKKGKKKRKKRGGRRKKKKKNGARANRGRKRRIPRVISPEDWLARYPFLGPGAATQRLVYWNATEDRNCHSTRPYCNAFIDTLTHAQRKVHIFGAEEAEACSYQDALPIPLLCDPDQRLFDEEEEEEEENTSVADDEAEEASEDEESGASDDEEEDEEEEPPLEFPPYSGPKRVAKIKMTVTKIPRQADPEETAGLIVLFLIKDPGVNPGAFFEDIVKANAAAETSKGRFAPPDPFVAYSLYAKDSWHPLSKTTSRNTYHEALENIMSPAEFQGLFQGRNSDKFLQTDIARWGSPKHMCKVCTPERALSDLREAGALPNLVRSVETWRTVCDQSDPAGPQSWSFPEKTWKYDPENTFFDSGNFIGLMEYGFPHIEYRVEIVDRLLNREYIDPNRITVTPRLDDDGNVIRDADGNVEIDEATYLAECARASHATQTALLSKSCRVERAALNRDTLLSYTTYNDYMRRAAETDIIYAGLARLMPVDAESTLHAVQRLVLQHGKENWRAHATQALLRRAKEYDDYCRILKEVQMARLRIFEMLWPLHGNPDTVPVSDPLKVILRWYQSNKHRLPNVTRKFTVWDPDLCIFGNIQLRQYKFFQWFANVLQPQLPLICQGLFSTYEHCRTPSTHILVRGSQAGGKTFTCIEVQMDFQFIPQTAQSITSSTERSDNFAHTYDTIHMKDECAESEIQHTEKGASVANKQKQMITGKGLQHRTSVMVEMPGGEKTMTTVTIHADHMESSLRITNAEEKRGAAALKSRYMTFVMKPTIVKAADVADATIDPSLMEDAKLSFQLAHYMSAFQCKAAATGATLPEIEMTIFYLISNQVLSYLKNHDCITNDNGLRSLDHLAPIVRQMARNYAYVVAYELPTSPHYNKPLKNRQAMDMAPYQYATLAMIWWAWTACASEFVDGDIANVVAALIKMSGVAWKKGDNGYDLFARDVRNTIPFLLEKNPTYNRFDQGGDGQWLVNLSYLSVKAPSFDAMLAAISAQTNPTLPPTMISGIIDSLATKSIPVGSTLAYAALPNDKMKRWHKFTDMECTTKQVGNDCPAEWNTDPFNRPPDQCMRTQADLTPLPSNSTLAPIVLCKGGRQEPCTIAFIPSVAERSREDIIEEALHAVCMSSQFPEGKILLGTPDTRFRDRLATAVYDREDIDAMVDELDIAAGFRILPNGERQYVGRADDEDEDEDDSATVKVPRKVGVSFSSFASLDSLAQELICSVPIAPKSSTDMRWKDAYLQGTRRMGAGQAGTVIESFDTFSATRRHLDCGRPLDEDVETPAYLMRKFKAWAAAHPAEKLVHNYDYPSDDVRAHRRRVARRNTQRFTAAGKQSVANQLTRVRSMSSLSRVEREAARRQRSESSLAELRNSQRNAAAASQQWGRRRQ